MCTGDYFVVTYDNKWSVVMHEDYFIRSLQSKVIKQFIPRKSTCMIEQVRYILIEIIEYIGE